MEPLHDLRSGHVAISFLKEGETSPQVPSEALDICAKGQEVTLADEALRKKLRDVKPSFGIHTIAWEPTADVLDGGSDSMPGLADSGSEYLIEDSSESDGQQVCQVRNPKARRSRAAPFHNELLPGWRARAKESVSYTHLTLPTTP